MPEKVLITGGGGYIGSILTPLLLDAGYKVTVVDLFRHGVNSLAAVCANPKFDAVRGDCRDEAVMREQARDTAWVIPLAAIVGAPACDLDRVGARTVNRDAVKMLIGLLSPEQRVIFPTTNSGYGVGEPGELCDETSPLRPISHYGTTKVEAERIVMDRGNSISFRLATVFGMAPRMRIDLLVNDFTYRAVYDRYLVIFEGRFKRNYIHIQDVANGFLFAMQHFGSMAGEVYNMGLSDANLSKLELAERIKQHLPDLVYVDAPVGEDPDKRDCIVSNAKLEATGWRPEFSLDEGIRELVKGYSMIRNDLYSNV
jgi:nucleoside-diphosphate-sugar epimerase